jgi:hypothetical protein
MRCLSRPGGANVKRKQTYKRTILGAGFLLLVMTVLVATVALAQSPQQTYNLSWWTADGGGGSSRGSNYALAGTAGQPDPGPVLSGGDFNLEGGFWGGGLSTVSTSAQSL